MIRIVSTVDINRPSEEVFNYIANFENNPRWQAGQIKATFTTEPPLRIGSTYDQVAQFLGRQIISEFEVIEYEPQRLVKASTTGGSFPITFTRIVEPAEQGCHVKAIVEGDASGFFKLAEPLMARMVQRSVDKDYRNLKQILESHHDR